MLIRAQIYILCLVRLYYDTCFLFKNLIKMFKILYFMVYKFNRLFNNLLHRCLVAKFVRFK